MWWGALRECQGAAAAWRTRVAPRCDLLGVGGYTAYREPVTRSPLFLAALASAAVPGLNPVAVRGGVGAPGHEFETAFVEDSERRHWTVRLPRSEAGGARLDAIAAMLTPVARRVPFEVPVPRGFARVREGRAMVYPFISGLFLELSAIPPGPGLAADIGRSLALLHNVDPAVYEEAGLPAYGSEDCRSRKLTELDRAAATGQLPPGLLARWEPALEDVSLWRFAALPIHGNVAGRRILSVFDDAEDAATGRVRGLLGWENAMVADPAEDFAALVAECPLETLDCVLEAYAQTCVQRPDPALRARARLASEMAVMTHLLRAHTAGDEFLAARWARELAAMEKSLGDAPPIDAGHRAPTGPVSVAPAVAHPEGLPYSGSVAPPTGAAGDGPASVGERSAGDDSDEPTQAHVPTWTDADLADEAAPDPDGVSSIAETSIAETSIAETSLADDTIAEDTDVLVPAIEPEGVADRNNHEEHDSPSALAPEALGVSEDEALLDPAYREAAPGEDDPEGIIDDEQEGASAFISTKARDRRHGSRPR